jgi:hypothetical protein
MAMSSSPRSSVATICAPAALDEDFKGCCLESGRHDGANRNDYFQGVSVAPVRRFTDVAIGLLTRHTKSVDSGN